VCVMTVGKRDKGRPTREIFNVRLTRAERTRLKLAAVSAGQTYAELIVTLLDEREAKAARRGVVASSPLHVGSE
jgi:hypothetical protein